MAGRILMRAEGEIIEAEVFDNPMGDRILEALPLSLSLSRWGEEYYGDCGVSASLGEGSKEEMEVGELAFWPPGNAFCIFFGPTPASSGAKPRAASAVMPFGKITTDPAVLKKLGGTVSMEISRKD